MSVAAERAQHLVELCRRLGDQDREEQQFRRLSTVTDDLEQRLAELDGVLAFLRQAVADGLPYTDELKGLPTFGLQQALADARAALAGSGDYEHGPVDEVLKPLEEFLRAVTGLARRVWAAHRQEAVPQGRRDLLKALAHLPGVRNQVQHLRTLEDELSGLVRKEIPSVDQYERFRALVIALNEAWAAMPMSDDPEVENFLTKAATGGAGLHDLTPAVSEWLDHQGLAGQFVIRPGAPPSQG